LKERAIRE
jgi:hypothetical protein